MAGFKMRQDSRRSNDIWREVIDLLNNILRELLAKWTLFSCSSSVENVSKLIASIKREVLRGVRAYILQSLMSFNVNTWTIRSS